MIHPFTIVLRNAVLRESFYKLLRCTPIRRRERLVPSSEQETRGIRGGMRSDFLQLTLNSKTETVKVQVVAIVIEGILAVKRRGGGCTSEYGRAWRRRLTFLAQSREIQGEGTMQMPYRES